MCPGSNNDRFIWQFSDVKEYMQSLRENRHVLEEEGPYYILGNVNINCDKIYFLRLLNFCTGKLMKLNYFF